MYKDVWKKFGAKVLIVLCSVLLMGGVAIAAPRLRASDGKAGTKVTFQQIVASGCAIEVKESLEYEYDFDTGKGKEKVPTYINIDGVGQLQRYVDFDVSTKNNVTEVSSDTWIEIKPVDTSTLIDAVGTGSYKLKVSYNINKNKSINDPDKVICTYEKSETISGSSNNNWVLEQLPGAFQPNDWKIYIDTDSTEQGRIPLEYGIDYEIEPQQDSSGVSQEGPYELGSYSRKIVLKNYELTPYLTAHVYKDVKALTIDLDRSHEPPVLTVKDGNKVLAENTDYIVIKNDSTWTIRGKGNYAKETTVSTSSGSSRINPSFTPYTVDYDDNNQSIIKKPERVYQDSESGAPLTEGVHYTLDNFRILDKGVVQEGATAGTVWMTFKGTGNYTGEVDDSYKLRRTLNSTALNVTLKAVNENDDFIFKDNKTTHIMKPEVTFSDSPSYKLRQGDDYTVQYNLYKNGKWQGWTSDTSMLANAGKVLVRIIGNAPENDNSKAGYYGSVEGTGLSDSDSLMYDIHPFDVSSCKIKFLLDGIIENNIFDVNCTREDIIERAYLVNGGTRYPIKDLGSENSGEYKVDFYKDSAHTVEIKKDEWGSLEPNTYYGVFRFMGNYEGDIPFTFVIDEYDADDIIVTLGKCSQCQNDSHHVYTGKEHKPKVVSVTYNGANVPYTVDYEDNVNAGTAKAVVTVGKIVVTKEFEINPRSLSDGKLDLTGEGFGGATDSRTHQYLGQKKGPDVPELTLLDTSDNKKIPLSLADGHYTLLPGIYLPNAGEDADPIPFDQAQKGQKYCFRIASSSPNFVNTDVAGTDAYYVETVAFEFTPRPLTSKYDGNKDAIVGEIAAKTTYEAFEETKYKNYILNNLKVTDREFGDVLRKDIDYEIVDVTDSLDTDGTVIFKIVAKQDSLYSEQIENQKLLVGVHIKTTYFWEKGGRIGYPVPNGSDVEPSAEISLKQSYARDSTNPNYFNIEFNAGPSYSATKVDVCANESQSSLIKAGEKYTVIPDKTLSFDENGNQYATVILQGKSGYHGQVKVKFNVNKININKEGYTIKIVNPEDYYYLGKNKPVNATIEIYDGDGNQITDLDNFQITYSNNLNATRGYPNNEKTGAKVTVTGKPSSGYVSGGVEAEIVAYYNIKPQPIFVEDKNGDKHLSPYFKTDGLKSEYPYRPWTTITNGEGKNGVWPFFNLWFDVGQTFGDDTKEVMVQGQNGDYQYTCENYENVTTPGNPAYVVITATGNFDGTLKLPYEINRVSLEASNKAISMDIDGGKRQPFIGSEYKPKVKVTQNVELYDEETGETYIEEITVKEDQYKIEYENTLWVSYSSVGGMGTQTCIRVVPSDKENYQGARELEFTIYGEFQPPEGPRRDNSNIKYSFEPIPYSDNISYNKYSKVYYQEKRDGQPEDSYNDKFDALLDDYLGRTRELQYGNDYTVSLLANEQEIVGIHSGYINAVEGGFFTGAKLVTKEIVIKGNLTTQATVEWKRGSATVPFGSATDLAKSIIVICGGKTLEYGEDYEFKETDLDLSEPGKKSVTIVPTLKAADKADPDADEGPRAYLTGGLLIEFNVVADITDENVSGLLTEYEYTGLPVIDPRDIVVTVNNKTLVRDTDYVIEGIQEAVDAGKHIITIRGISDAYLDSQVSFTITIKPYDLTQHDVVVRYGDELASEPTVIYTGKEALPTSIRVQAPTDTGSITLQPGDDEHAADYEVVAGAQGDHINWTNPRSDKPKPTYIIRGLGNFTGEITREYMIEPRDISEAEFEDIGERPYQNGRPVTPPVIGKYGPLKQLTGIAYNEKDVDRYPYWDDNTQHFTYQYKPAKDLSSVGDKSVEIQGIGNFTGKVTLYYKVVALDIKKAELKFLSDESPVYDGEYKKPGFQLIYEGDVIFEYNGTTIVSSHINTATVEYKNNLNATKEGERASVVISLAEDGDNYFGSKEAFFVILPAPLENHVRFMYHPKDANGDADLSSYKLSLPFLGEGKPSVPLYAQTDTELADGEVGMYYNYPQKANHGDFLVPGTDIGSEKDSDGFSIEYKYVEPDTENTDIREEYDRPTPDWAGKVRVTITGKNNYTGKASFWYFIGDDISSDAKISMTPATAVFNSLNQYPKVTISGIDENRCHISNYWKEVLVENLISNKEFINAGTYYIRIEGKPSAGTYATKPETLKFTITPRALSNSLVIDGFKKEYSYTGYEIRPVGISVTDYIDNIKYRLTEDEDYVLSYSNNLNVGIAYINVKGQGNFSGSAATNFLITSSTISSGGINGSNSFLDGGSGEISGTVPVSPNNVNLTMDTSDAMYYTGKAVYPKVSISGMTENIDYTVTFSNNVEVGIGVATINGIGNNNGVITKNFRIIAPLSKCTISPIPAQQYTGSAVTPSITVRCGNTVLMEGTDYAVSYANNINIGTATVTIRALNNANYTGTATAKFSIGNDVGGFIISGYAPSYAYTGNAITPGVVVETGSSTLTLGTDYTVSYSNNVNSGTATITVTGIGKYSGTQTANFIIEGKNIQSCDTTEVADRTYTGDAYTPDITVSDGGKVLKNGVDYTVTYTNNTNPGTASIIIQGVGSNYTGTKVISFKISAVAVKGLKASSVKYNSIKLKWTKQEYADGYQVCDSNSKVVKTVKTNSATITGLSAAKTYKYKVRSYVSNSDGTKSYGTFSSVLSTTTKLKTPTVKVVSNAKGQARISWSKVSRATGYEIYYKKSAKAKYKKLKTVNNANIRVCKVRGMNSGDRAYFRVRAFRKSGSKKIYSALNPLKVITVK